MSALPRSYELDEPFAYHDPNRRGFVALLRPNAAGDRVQTPVQLARLPDYLKRLDKGVDHWIAQSEFFKPNRRVVNLWHLPVAFVDLDTYKAPHLSKLSPSSLRDVLLDVCDQQGVPYPSLVVFSGRGLQAKWVLDPPVPRAALPRWAAVQAELQRRLSSLQSDTQAMDASRVLRLVGSWHSKSKEQVRVLHTGGLAALGSHVRADGLAVYNFDVLADTLLPLSRPELAELRKSREQDSVMRDIAQARKLHQQQRLVVIDGGAKQGPKSAHPNLRPFLPHQLAWDRLDDIRKLVELRYGTEGAPPGRRNLYLFLAACFLAHAVVVPNLKEEIRELATHIAPTWTEAELQSCISSVVSRAEASASGQRISYGGRDVDPRYRWSNKGLLEVLEVRDAEQCNLKTIIGKEHASERAADRERQRRRQAGALPWKEYAEQREQGRVAARLLRAQGRTYAQIAAELGISKGAAHNYCSG
jgi:hypothetical protein